MELVWDVNDIRAKLMMNKVIASIVKNIIKNVVHVVNEI